MIHRTVCLLIASFFVSRAAADEPKIEVPSLKPGPYHVMSTHSRKLAITITHDLPQMEGVVYFPLPPDTSSQRVASCKLSVVSDKRRLPMVKASDSGPLKKPVQEVELKQFAGGKVTVELNVELSAARVEPGNPKQPVRKLPDAERAALTAADWHYEYDTAFFHKWMAENSLTRAESERDADFALRVLAFIRRNFEYKIHDFKEMQDKIARQKMDDLAYFIDEKSAECWGLSSIYTSVLRGNGIPCRQINGFVLEQRPVRRGLHHVRAEVYLEGIGWVLVELAGAVTAKNQPLHTFFGHRGDDMVLLDQGVNYILPGPKNAGRIGTLSGFAIGTADDKWSFPYGTWEIKVRN